MIVFSDVHGNLKALNELLSREAGPLVCAGDVLGTGGGNQECLDLLQDRGIPCAAGNHEMDFLWLYQSLLRPETTAWVETWPYVLDYGEVRVVHTLLEPGLGALIYRQVERPEEALRLMRDHPARVVFMGHRHLPGWWEISAGEATWRSAFGEEELVLREGSRYAVDVGSLGEPQPPQKGSYIHFEGSRIRFRRLG
ncbi:MAG: metallophosphoesterase family protein [Candidatus Eremiobacterota bacterium]